MQAQATKHGRMQAPDGVAAADEWGGGRDAAVDAALRALRKRRRRLASPRRRAAALAAVRAVDAVAAQR
jgi:hypothetical protein